MGKDRTGQSEAKMEIKIDEKGNTQPTKVQDRMQAGNAPKRVYSVY